MLGALSINDVVLIDRLDLAFHPSLNVLTGETGAGKSILLDALGLAIGMRADSDLVRHGAGRASVCATFEVGPDHPAWALLAEHDLEADGELLLRRTVREDGGSRAFVNDQPVSVGLLRAVGETLVEVHGQFESHRLLAEATHRDMLDAFGDLDAAAAATAAAHAGWQEAVRARRQAEAAFEAARRDEEFLRHAVGELTALSPEAGEEAALAGARSVMMHGEKLLGAVDVALGAVADGGGGGVDQDLRTALGHLEAVRQVAAGRLDDAVAALERASLETAEGIALLGSAAAGIDLDAAALERVEERLFALRGLARKHGVAVDGLAALAEDLAARLAAVEDGAADIERLAGAEKGARDAFAGAAREFSRGRAAAAQRLDEAVSAELGPLKLGRAQFTTRLEPLVEADWGSHGCERVAFRVATNPGGPAGPLNRISSGGELARFTLALKVVLAGADPVPTLVFDEVDSGVGGQVAAAVGERLERLAEDFQVLVVTHSPQVAARGRHHMRVSKSEPGRQVLTQVEALPEPARKEEIARMLAGARVTDEARAAADSLLRGAKP